MGKIYCEAKFWRPTGLGNRLFSWARCEMFSRKTGASMLSPSWGHVRGASIIRGGIDYSNAWRKILLFDNFKDAPHYISGLAKYKIQKAATPITVNNLPESLSVYGRKDLPERVLISFAGDKDHVFNDLRSCHKDILEALRMITREKWLRPRNLPQPPFIGINVRMGKDFKTAVSERDFLENKKDFLRTPLHWYIESLRFIRNIAGMDIPAVILSDGSKTDLKELLKEPSVFYPDSRSAIGDLLTLSDAGILIGAGRSSFSAWAS